MYKEEKFKVEGIAPLLMHNGQLADPLCRWTQEMKVITSKRKKTEDDFERLAQLEWMGGLYLDDKGAPAIPGELIEAMLIGAAWIGKGVLRHKTNGET